MYFYYYDLEKAKHGILFCKGIEDSLIDTDLHPEKKELYNNSFVYNGKVPLDGYPIVEDGKIRIATNEELIVLGIIPKPNGYIIKDGAVTKIAPDSSLFVPKWSNDEWLEGANDELKKKMYFDTINTFKKKILNSGFVYVDINGFKHNQKTRIDVDIPLVSSTIRRLDNKIKRGELSPYVLWSFEDGDLKQMSFEDMSDLDEKAGDFIEAVYESEKILKSKIPNKLISIKDFTKEISRISKLDCCISGGV